MPRYVATVNIPGYLPMDDDPPVFDTAREAWEYLADERRRDEDEYEGDYTDTVRELDTLASAASPDADWTGSVWGPTPGYEGNHDLGLSYCVDLAEED